MSPSPNAMFDGFSVSGTWRINFPSGLLNRDGNQDALIGDCAILVEIVGENFFSSEFVT
jgi:hypothetical protein